MIERGSFAGLAKVHHEIHARSLRPHERLSATCPGGRDISSGWLPGLPWIP